MQRKDNVASRCPPRVQAFGSGRVSLALGCLPWCHVSVSHLPGVRVVFSLKFYYLKKFSLEAKKQCASNQNPRVSGASFTHGVVTGQVFFSLLGQHPTSRPAGRTKKTTSHPLHFFHSCVAPSVHSLHSLQVLQFQGAGIFCPFARIVLQSHECTMMCSTRVVGYSLAKQMPVIKPTRRLWTLFPAVMGR